MYLIHHGVKGQQWGVRHGPPYPIEDKIMRKGHRLNSVSYKYLDSEEYRKSGRPMYTYNPNDEWDVKVYKGPFSKFLVISRGAELIKEHQYELVKDLKMPTKSERIKEFKDLYNDKKFKKEVVNTLDYIKTELVKYNVGSSAEMKENIKNFDSRHIKSENDWKTAYEIFNHAMEAQHSFKSTSEYLKRMSSKYDAMVDDNNQGFYNDAHDPVIIFRAYDVLKTVGDTPAYSLTANDIITNYNDVRNELESKGKVVKL